MNFTKRRESRSPFPRLSRIPPYLFSSLHQMKTSVGKDLIDLGEGNPDIPPPAKVVTALCRALKNQENHRYPTYAGKQSLREAIAYYYRQRFGVVIDPDIEALPLLGSKEGAAHLIWAICEEGDRVGVCDPGFPVYLNQTRLCYATPVLFPLKEQNGFLPDLNQLSRVAPKLKLLCLNYPNNPTTGVAKIEFYQEVVNLALKYGFFVVNDNVYSEIYFGAAPPPSILQVPGARECCIELNSLSKTFSIPGWRMGMAVGNRNILSALLKMKQNIDTGPFGAIQDAAVFALKNYTRFATQIREVYRKRRDVFVLRLNRQGWRVMAPEATFYIWAKLPDFWNKKEKGSTSYGFVKEMLKSCRVLGAPGVGFGNAGEGFVRFALIASQSKLIIAAERIGRWLNDYKR